MPKRISDLPLASSLNATTDYLVVDQGNPATTRKTSLASLGLAVGTAASAVATTQVGTGAVIRSVEDKLREVISVKDFGAVGNGVADDTSPITVALAAAASLLADRFLSAVYVHFPYGIYKVSSTILINSSNIFLVGCSPSGSMLYAPNANFDVVKFDGSALSLYYVGMINMKIYAPGNTTAGALLTTNRCINSIFRDLMLVGWYDGIISDGCAKTFFSNIILSQENRTNGTTFRYGMDFKSTSFNNSDVHVENVQIVYDTSVLASANTVSIRGSDGIYFTNGHQFGATLIQPSAVTCGTVMWNNWYFDQSTNNNVKFSGTSSTYTNFWFSNCYFRASGGNGLEINSASTLGIVQLSNCKFSGHRLNGIYDATSVTGLIVNSCAFDGNNTDNAAGTGDIYVTGTATVNACRFTGGGAAGTAVTFTASSSDCIISGSSLVGTTAGTKISNSGTNNIIRGNTGYRTKQRGQAIITNPATSITVTHNLSAAPLAGQVQLSFGGSGDSSGVTRARAYNFTSSTFDIILNAAPTTTATVDWLIDAET